MRISDGSSDVCPTGLRARSDFEPRWIEQRGDIARAAFGLGITRGFAHEEGGEQSGVARHRHRGGGGRVAAGGDRMKRTFERVRQIERGVGDREDRTSVVEGKSGSVRVDPGGRRNHKKHNTTKYIITYDTTIKNKH